MANEVKITATMTDRTGPGAASVVRNVNKIETASNAATKSTTGLADKGFARAQAAGARFGEVAQKGGAALAGIAAAGMVTTAVLDKGITTSLTTANAQVALGREGFASLSAAADANANVMGFTRSEFLATAGSAASLAKNLGFSQEASAKLGAAFPDLADKLAILSNGKVTAATAADQLRSAMAGEFDPLQAMGIAINAAAVEQRALTIEQQSSTAITRQQATAMAVLAIVQEQTADASKVMATEAGRAAAEAQQAQAELRQAYEELSATAVPVLSELTQSAANLGQSWQTVLTGGESFVEWAQAAFKVVAPLTNVVDALRGKTEEEGEASSKAALNVAELGEGAKAAAGSQEDLAKATDEAVDAITEQIDVALGGRDAARGYQEALDKASESLGENGRTLDITTEKGRANSAALDAIAVAAREQADAVVAAGGSEQDFQGQLERSRTALVRQAIRFGMTKTEARAYAAQVLGIPKKWDTRVHLDSRGAIQGARDVRIAIANIRGKTVMVNIRQTTFRSAVDIGQARGEKRTGGVWGGAAAAGGARGGMVLVGEDGPELAQLGAGAFVHTAGATKRMLSGGGGGAPGVIVLNVDIAGSRLGQLLIDPLRREVKTLGGDVQAVLGSGRARSVA